MPSLLSAADSQRRVRKRNIVQRPQTSGQHERSYGLLDTPTRRPARAFHGCDPAVEARDCLLQNKEVAMSMTEARDDESGIASVKNVDFKLEVVVIPVSDVDRAKEFCGSLGWRLYADFSFDNGFRVVQFTPPGSECSVQFGTKMTSAAPGSAHSHYLIVSDIQAARGELATRGVDVSEVFYPGTPGAQFQTVGTSGRVNGPAPDHASYSSFATFSDPDGNTWLLQEITMRLPGRIDATETTFASTADLTSALRRAAIAHGEHESRTGQ